MYAKNTSPPDQPGIDDRLLALLRSLLRSSWKVGRDPGAQLERLSRSFVRRTVERAVSSPRSITDRAALLEHFETPKTEVPFSTTSAALVAGKVLRRVGPLQVLARRTPVLAAATAVPEIYSSLTRSVDDVTAVASFLTHHVRRSGGTPDADRIRRATVQLLGGGQIDPEVEPAHDELVWSWMKRAARGLLPFAGHGATKDAKRVATVAAAIDPALLQAR